MSRPDPGLVGGREDGRGGAIECEESKTKNHEKFRFTLKHTPVHQHRLKTDTQKKTCPRTRRVNSAAVSLVRGCPIGLKYTLDF